MCVSSDWVYPWALHLLFLEKVIPKKWRKVNIKNREITPWKMRKHRKTKDFQLFIGRKFWISCSWISYFHGMLSIVIFSQSQWGLSNTPNLSRFVCKIEDSTNRKSIREPSLIESTRLVSLAVDSSCRKSICARLKKYSATGLWEWVENVFD